MRMHALCICVRYVPLLHTSDINNSIIQNNSVLRSKSFRQQVDDINELVVALDLFIWQCNKISTMKCGGEIGDISRISTIAHSLHLFFKKKLNRFVFYLWKSQGFPDLCGICCMEHDQFDDKNPVKIACRARLFCHQLKTSSQIYIFLRLRTTAENRRCQC